MDEVQAGAGLGQAKPARAGSGPVARADAAAFGRELVAARAQEAGSAPALPRRVVVRSGDTVWGLARRHGSSVARIARENGLADANRIRPGQVLAIPPSARAVAAESDRLPSVSSRPPSAMTQGVRGPEQGVEVRVHRHVVGPGDTLWKLAVETFHVHVDELARQNGIADPSRLRLGQELRIERQIDRRPREVVASWYGPGFDGKPMANGQPYDRHAATIAHKALPLGSEVELTNPQNGRSVRAVVTDRGPYVEGREVDLSYGLARTLGLLEAGVGRLILRERG